jgi:HK97 family phage major capsid protein
LVPFLFGIGAVGAGFIMANVVGFTDPQQLELKALFEAAGEKHKATVKTEVGEALKGVVTLKELDEKFKAIGLEEKTIEKILKAVDTQGAELRKMLDEQNQRWGGSGLKSIGEILNESKEAIKALATGGKNVKLVLPSNSVNKTLVERSAVGSSTQAMRLSEIGQLDYLNPIMRSLFSAVSISPDSNGTIRYIDQSTATRNADNKAEAAEAPESVIAWTERSATLQKIMDSIPVSMEAFRDVNFIEGEINQLLNVNLVLKEDQQLYAGSGVAPQLKGFNTSAAAFDPTGYSGTVDAANIYDLIAAVRTAMMNGNKKYNPTFIVMNPIDIFKAKVLKGADGHYILPPFVGPNGETIMGMRVVESAQVTANTFTMGDGRYGTIYDDGGIEIEMGYVDDQFTKDTMTIKARKRTMLLIRTVNEGGFKKVASITSSVADLTAP